KSVTRGSVQAIVLASLMRILLFMAALGVVMNGGLLNPGNPAASVFRIAAGEFGYMVFGIVLWSAAITSVVGSAYTSVSFLRTFHPWFEKNQRWLITVFILVSTTIFTFVGKPVKTLIVVGALNGFILPIALALMLFSARKALTSDYRHPQWLTVSGWFVVVIMAALSLKVMLTDLPKLWS
ncbi:MAG: divalent metal cation transporter, partial [Chitinophagaceae bacterium]|nr:divalent metal cation transporter [Chitinophagaceae bacterium]